MAIRVWPTRTSAGSISSVKIGVAAVWAWLELCAAKATSSA
ncbi:MAG TPA: hypothetical protein VN847_17445 [Streptosporangiaceae bacterium]|nr:hypothetical protein [Streptosporangiaceae bacterium]